MYFQSYTILLVIFRHRVPFKRTPNNFDLNLVREGGSRVNKKLPNGFSDPENKDNDGLKENK